MRTSGPVELCQPPRRRPPGGGDVVEVLEARAPAPASGSKISPTRPGQNRPVRWGQFVGTGLGASIGHRAGLSGATSRPGTFRRAQAITMTDRHQIARADAAQLPLQILHAGDSTQPSRSCSGAVAARHCTTGRIFGGYMMALRRCSQRCARSEPPARHVDVHDQVEDQHDPRRRLRDGDRDEHSGPRRAHDDRRADRPHPRRRQAGGTADPDRR